MCLWSVVVLFQPGHSCPSSRSLFGTWANLTSDQHLPPVPSSSTLRKGRSLAPSPHQPSSNLQHRPSYFHPACLYLTANHTHIHGNLTQAFHLTDGSTFPTSQSKMSKTLILLNLLWPSDRLLAQSYL